MRKLSSILAALVLLVTSVTSAAVVTEEMKVLPTEKQIGALLENPTFEISEDEQAFVTFMLNDANEIVVLTVDTENPVVEKFVKQRLNYHKIETGLKTGKEYHVPISIHYEA